MPTKIAVIVVAMIAIGALEIWLFWRLGGRDRRRRSQGRSAPRRWGQASDEGYNRMLWTTSVRRKAAYLPG